ncbi:hypothetical protein KII95_01680 [Leuconostoc gelidum subsp. aenigmaticum]|uniref:hypothetical protein n=1 Tax=Leuconostoc gelidum TaxID=1244 RepID=UPI001CC442EE|nr:hypothetical protein [Leuconostoc gelidum]MBZ6002754.1 hypothetical protein [Leuconostoc gelidum subsp. aenigmaticum]
MENKIEITNQMLIVIPQGLDKIASFKSKLEIPLQNVVGASIDMGILNENKGFRNLGTALPGYWAGSYDKNGEKSFFNIKKEAKPIVIQLRNEKFNRLILGADNAEKIVDAINNNIK